MATGDIVTATVTTWTTLNTDSGSQTASTSSADTWQTWNDSTNADTWNNGWTSNTNSTPSVRVAASWTPGTETAEQRVAREAAECKRQEKRKQATKTAEKLLKECLSPEQREEYSNGKRFHVISQDGNRYEIDCEKAQHNVDRLDSTGKRIENLCAYQTGSTPLPDNALAQKLMLETDESQFRRIANIRRIA